MATGPPPTLTTKINNTRETNRTDPQQEKRHRSIFDLPPDFFDSCHLLSSPHSSLTPICEHLDNPNSSAPETLDFPQDGANAPKNVVLATPRWTCNTCKGEFDSLQDQRSHFKSDIHRFNVKLHIAGKNIVREEDFDEFTSDSFKDFDISSISGSEDEAEKEFGPNRDLHRGTTGNSKQHLYIRLNTGEQISFWKSLLINESENISIGNDIAVDNGASAPCLEENDVIERVKSLIREPRDNTRLRIVLLASGGHFAGCVFDGSLVVAHKTFHRYVVRAKAGKKQSSKDAGGKTVHSAGASLRRYNELALKKDVQELLAAWKPYFDASTCIFVYAPSNNHQLLFNGEKPYFSNRHGVVRNVPLTVRRPTLKEAKRIYNQLTQVAYEIDEKEIPLSIEEDLCSRMSTINVGILGFSKEDMGDESGHRDNVDACSSFKKSDELSVSSESEIELMGRSTPLHEAAQSGNAQKVLELLEQGLDPCCKDERGRTPYMVANEKEVRNSFRRFMASNLEKWDWQAAKVPSALTKEMEESQTAKQAEKDAKRKARAKELKKLRKAKEKKAQSQPALSQIALKVVENRGATSTSVLKGSQPSGGSQISKEEELKRAMAAEREKRAAAAEGRLAAAAALDKPGNSSPTVAITSQPGSGLAGDINCSCCNTSLAGKVPFHRYNYKYCSTSCMHVHREILEDG
ncbi:ankyrin repeat and zinc finger domain-containing protein 1 isoform X1 [Carya illinoinensis]|uniref:VLRF1 domain-containing protein n=1 Tax=Carya illinoinensis TaxID=32201 RepID=A0A8T1RUA6_CARIL|nr:ankyrin repeat and zinc finger domain-containing protein 1 isoform X1 [Carya illinoinensis]KAG6669672.1 hypothetical protein CIPAW_01G260400 [Carya illinoinensis]